MPKESGEIATAFWASVVGVVGAALATWLLGWWPLVWTGVSGFMGSVWVHLMAQSQWPNWSAYILSLIAAISLSRMAMRYWSSRKDNLSRFNQLRFLGAVWRWRDMSSLNYTLRPYCPKCDTALVYSERLTDYDSLPQTQWHCQPCKMDCVTNNGFKKDLDGRVIREIDRLTRSGQWRSKVD